MRGAKGSQPRSLAVEAVERFLKEKDKWRSSVHTAEFCTGSSIQHSFEGLGYFPFNQRLDQCSTHVEFPQQNGWRSYKHTSLPPKPTKPYFKDLENRMVDDFRRLVADKDINYRQKDAIVQKVFRNVDAISPYTYANIILCCKRGGYYNSSLFELTCNMLTSRQDLRSKLKEMEIGMMLLSMSVLKRQCPDGSMNADSVPSLPDFVLGLIDECMRREVGNYNNMDTRTCANCIFGLGSFVRLGVIERDDAAPMIDALIKKVSSLKRVHTLTPIIVSDIVYGCAMMGYVNERSLDRICRQFQEILGRNREQVTGYHLGVVIWSLGRLGFRHLVTIDALAMEVVASVSEFSNQSLCMVINGFALLEYKNERALSRICEEFRKKPRLDRIKDQELCNTIHAFSLLGYVDRPTLDALCEEICKDRRLGNHQEQHLASVIACLGRLGYMKDSVAQALCTEVCDRRRLVRFKEQELSSILNGFASIPTFKLKDGIATLSMELVAPHRLKRCKEKELVDILQGLAKAQYFDRHVVTQLLVPFQNIGRFWYPGLTLVPYNLALLEPHMTLDFLFDQVSPVLQATATESLQPAKLAQFGPKQICYLCWAMGTLKFYDATFMDEMLLRYCRKVGGKDRIPQSDILMLVHACAMVNHKNDQFLHLVSHYVNGGIEYNGENAHRQIINDLWSLSVLGVLSPKVFEKYCIKLDLLLFKDSTNVTNSEWMQLLHAWLFVRDRGVSPNSHVTKLMQKVEESVRTMQMGVEKSENAINSVHRILEALKIPFNTNVTLQDLSMVADFVVGVDPNVIVHIDGPVHYTINEIDGRYMLLGHVALRNRLLEEKGHKVVEIPVFEWEGLPNDRARKEYLQNLLHVRH